MLFIDDEFFDGDATDEVFHDDALERAWCARAIPNAVGVDDGDGPILADAETVRFGTIDFSTLRKV